VLGWGRESEKKKWHRLNEQYHKAWFAGFPPELWATRRRTDRRESGVAAERWNDFARQLIEGVMDTKK